MRLIVDLFVKLLESQRGQATFPLASLAGQCFRGLQRQLEQLLGQMADLILQGRGLEALRESQRTRWPMTLTPLLHIAAGWLYFYAPPWDCRIRKVKTCQFFGLTKEPSYAWCLVRTLFSRGPKL